MSKFRVLVLLLACLLPVLLPATISAAPGGDREDSLEQALYGFGNAVTVSQDAAGAAAYLSPGLQRTAAKSPAYSSFFKLMGFGSTLPRYYQFAIQYVTTAEAQVTMTWKFSNGSTVSSQLYWFYTVAGWKIGSSTPKPAPAPVVLSSLNTYSKMTFTGTCQPASKANTFPPNPMNLYARATFSRWTGKQTAVFNWSLPGGALYAAHIQHGTGQAGSTPVLCDTLNLDGPYPGTWTLRLTLDGKLARSLSFNVPPM